MNSINDEVKYRKKMRRKVSSPPHLFIQITKIILLLAVHQLADGAAESLHALEHVLVADVGEVQTQSVLALAVAEEYLADDEGHVLLDGDFEELLRIQALGHGNEQEETSLRSCPVV